MVMDSVLALVFLKAIVSIYLDFILDYSDRCAESIISIFFMFDKHNLSGIGNRSLSALAVKLEAKQNGEAVQSFSRHSSLPVSFSFVFDKHNL